MEGRHRRKERIVHLTTVHNVRDPRIYQKQLKSLKIAGYEACLVAPAKDHGIINGIPVSALPQIEGRYRRVKLQKKAYKAARNLNASLYHFHDPELIPLGYLLKRMTGATVIYDMHEDYRWHGPIEGRFIRLLERWCFSWVDHVVLAERAYQPIVGAKEVPRTVIENYFKPSGRDTGCAKNAKAGSLNLLYAGVVGETRGLSSMLELAARLHRTGTPCSLRIVGACYKHNERTAALDAIRSMEADVEWVEKGRYVPFEALRVHYQWADAGLALYAPDPNYVQSYPTKFYEYLHYGLPILCSDFPQWRRFIEKHACGAVVPPRDVSAAAQVLRRWRNNPDEYRALSEAARAAAPRYRWAVMERRLLNVYDALLRTSG